MALVNLTRFIHDHGKKGHLRLSERTYRSEWTQTQSRNIHKLTSSWSQLPANAYKHKEIIIQLIDPLPFRRQSAKNNNRFSLSFLFSLPVFPFLFPPLFSVCLPKSSHKLRKQIGRGGSQQPHQTLHKMDVPRAIFSSSSRAAWVDIVLTVGCLKGEAWVARFLWVFSLGDGGGRCCWW